MASNSFSARENDLKLKFTLQGGSLTSHKRSSVQFRIGFYINILKKNIHPSPRSGKKNIHPQRAD